VSSQQALESTKKQLQEIAPTVQWGSLDVFQRQFCESFSNNIRLLAPAGSGKTQSLLWRCAEVYRRQDEKARFLVVTFTRAARDELRTRLSGKEFRGVADATEVATLNAWGYRRIRAHHHSPRLLTTERDKNYCAQNALQPVWRAHARIESAMKGQPYVVGPVLMNVIERLKMLGFRHPADDRRSFVTNAKRLCNLGLDHLLAESIHELHELGILERVTMEGLIEEFVPFWGQACETMIEQSLFTLEDQKYVALLDLQRQLAERRLPIGGSRLTHVLVDEFQDINPLDLELIKAIVQINKSELTIVGDDDQAIFEWRGASPNYILTPDSHFGRPFDTYILERNYRCPRNLVEASQRLIVRNTRRQPKRVEPVNPEDARVTVISRENFTAGWKRTGKATRGGSYPKLNRRRRRANGHGATCR